MANVDIFVFLICPRTDPRREDIRCKRYPDRLVRRHMQKCDQHRRNDRRRRKSRKTRSKAGTEAGHNTYD